MKLLPESRKRLGPMGACRPSGVLRMLLLLLWGWLPLLMHLAQCLVLFLFLQSVTPLLHLYRNLGLAFPAWGSPLGRLESGHTGLFFFLTTERPLLATPPTLTPVRACSTLLPAASRCASYSTVRLLPHWHEFQRSREDERCNCKMSFVRFFLPFCPVFPKCTRSPCSPPFVLNEFQLKCKLGQLRPEQIFWNSFPPWLLWWLVLCVNLTGLRDAQIASKTLFLDVSVKVFPKKFSIFIGELTNAGGPPQCREALSNWLSGTKGRGILSLSLSAWDETSILSCPQTLRFLVPDF